MPFNAHKTMRSLPTWPTKSKSPPIARSRQTSVDLNGFGVPSPADPDPFGVRALEEAGLMIKEAGTQSRPSSEAFEFRPSPSSPVFRNSFQSTDGLSKRDSRRDSRRSNLSVDQGTQTADLPSPFSEQEPTYVSPTHLAAAAIPSPIRENERIEAWSADVRHKSEEREDRESDGKLSPTYRTSPLRESWTAGESNYHDAGVNTRAVSPPPTDSVPVMDPAPVPPPRKRTVSQRLSDTLARLERESLPQPIAPSPVEPVVDDRKEGQNAEVVIDDEFDDDDSEDEEEAEVAEVVVEKVVQAPTAIKVVAASVVSPAATRAKLVTIKGRPAPAIPARNPARQRRVQNADTDSPSDRLTADRGDESSSACSLSPARSAFDRDDHSSHQWSEHTSLPDETSIKSRRESITHIEPAVETVEDDAVAEEDSQATEHVQLAGTDAEDFKPDGSLAETVALALSPTNDSHLSISEESKQASHVENTSTSYTAEESMAHNAPAILSSTEDYLPNTPGNPTYEPPSTTLASPSKEKSPLTPETPRAPFSDAMVPSNKDADQASVSDYDAHSHDDRSQYGGEDEAWHSMPTTPPNEREQPFRAAEIDALGLLHSAPTASPLVGGMV